MKLSLTRFFEIACNSENFLIIKSLDKDLFVQISIIRHIVRDLVNLETFQDECDTELKYIKIHYWKKC